MPEQELITTPDKMRLTANELANASDEALNLFISDAQLDVDSVGFKEAFREKATRYLACHLAVLNNQNTKMEQVGSLKKEYSGFHSTYTDLKRTVYGQEYLRLLNAHSMSKGLSMVVI